MGISGKRPVEFSAVAPKEVWVQFELSDSTPRFAVNRAIHSLVFGYLSEYFGRFLAAEIHKAQIKPFAISPPLSGDRSDLHLDEVPAGVFWVRVGFAQPVMADLFAAFAERARGIEFRAAGGRAGAAFGVIKAERGRAWRVPEVRPSRGRSAVVLEMLSPVVFRRGRLASASLDPAMLVRSLTRKAAALGLTPLAGYSEAIARLLAFRRVRVSTVPYQIWADWTAWGLVGVVEMELAETDPRVIGAWNVLLDLADYLGLGTKTGFGAGYVRVARTARPRG